MKHKDLVATRSGNDHDVPFIHSTWLKSLRYGNDWFKQIDQKAYFREYNKVIDRILAKPTTLIKIAHLADDPEIILGYAIFEPGVSRETILHWVYVKQAWRRIGIARLLIPDNVGTITHLTKMGHMLKHNSTNVAFNPFQL